jgi:branched-subunit amino acid transport protein
VTAWIVVLAVGAGSYAIRLLPLLAVARTGLPRRAADLLRHAGTGALTALVVLAVLGGPGGGGVDVAVLVAVAVGALVAWSGRPMLVVVAAGAGSYLLASLLGAAA